MSSRRTTLQAFRLDIRCAVDHAIQSSNRRGVGHGVAVLSEASAKHDRKSLCLAENPTGRCL